MHELSIALSMIEMASEEAERRAGAQVKALHLKLGPLSGVVKEALLFSYEVACSGTRLEGSRLIIEDVPVVVYCQRCRSEQEVESIQRFCCPACGTLTSEVVRGRELEFVAMEIAEIAEIEEIEEVEEGGKSYEAAEDKGLNPLSATDSCGQLEEVA
jgi:hydrogenase nickel incorporation protein HypA/HybF